MKNPAEWACWKIFSVILLWNEYRNQSSNYVCLKYVIYANNFIKKMEDVLMTTIVSYINQIQSDQDSGVKTKY